MAAKRATGKRRYSAKAADKVGDAIHEMKRGKLKSGRSKTKVKSRKQAIAIGLSEARAAGAKTPPKKGARKAAKKRKAPTKKRKAPTKRRVPKS